MRRELPDGYELDDDPRRVDVAAVHAYIGGESYWGRGRSADLTERAIRGSDRVLGLYHAGRQVGFARAITDGAIMAYLADVYVLPEHRGRGLGLELVREIVEGGGANVRWMLHTADAQGLYAKLGFLASPANPPSYPLMERARDYDSRS
ncbi:MAG TPA: GNAT family N-acetyltransferase [Solirubrobacteraceae bacterium]|jgi:GNAT superfamily N-acetyltransferase|nr:GNAT family N-acetyltransferase [Solirubrobacteraceae bacterium]